ncbi:hypothetical protein WDW86_11730 [Bdellovibrionota bacterium FG-2]
MKLQPRRAKHFDITDIMVQKPRRLDAKLLDALERADLMYRTMCAILFNFVPQSGHPGGSISSGRIVQSLMFHSMDYDFSTPNRLDMDTISYAAGHKAMGLYAAWALRNEMIRVAKPSMLPTEKFQLRLEDLLGFRRNPTSATPLFKEFHAKALDGHPTPATPFVRLATGASGVGVAASFGLAMGMADTYGIVNSPRLHVLEGEGGMTPGRVQESLATAATAQLSNLVLHVDWNQASIDSNRVCREGQNAGDYVQWSPAEVCYVNDWNVITVSNGFDFGQILAAQKFASEIGNSQPTAIVYRTVKGWKYGIEGRTSHGAGHAFCSDGFYTALSEFEKSFGLNFPKFDGDKSPEKIEQLFFDCLLVLRKAIESNRAIAEVLSTEMAQAQTRLKAKTKPKRADVPELETLYQGLNDDTIKAESPPAEVLFEAGKSVTLRGALGDVLSVLNKKTKGAIIGSAADLFDSTSLSGLAKDFPPGFYNAVSNPLSRLLPTGGICEDAMGGVMAGLASFGNHIGVGSSYGAFIAALQHVPARLHAIGQRAKAELGSSEQNPFFIVCAHAGPKTGEDGPTHADPQALQLLQENFPRGSMITLTPWCANEMWPLVVTALKKRPAVIAPFVTRPSEPVIDRAKYKLAPASDCVTGVYALRRVQSASAGTIVLHGNGVATSFVTEVLPALDAKGLALNVFYVASAELFDLLSPDEQERIFPENLAHEAMGITEFTLSTMYRWITSSDGRRRTLHPFNLGHFLGSGQGAMVFQEAGLDGKSQLKSVMEYVGNRKG